MKIKIKATAVVIILLTAVMHIPVYAKLLACWPLDGNGKPSAGNTSIKFESNPAFEMDRFEKTGKALVITALKDIGTIEPDPAWDFSAGFSFECWVQVFSEAHAGIFYQEQGVIIRTTAERNILYGFAWDPAKNNWHKALASDKGINKHRWQHLVFTLEKGIACFYINGEKNRQIGSYPGDVPINKKYQKYPFVIGNFSKNILNGSIDDIKIYNHALSDDEVKDNYAASKPDNAGVQTSSKTAEQRLTIFVSEKNGVNLDGNINENAWNDLEWSSGFTHYKSGAPAVHPTSFKSICNEKGLFFAVKCGGGKVVAAKEGLIREKGEIYKDDVVEIIITPNIYQYDNIRQLVFNAKGAQSQYLYTNEIPWQVKSRINGDGYTAEVFIPYESLGLGNNKIIGFNICRESKIEGQEQDISSWAGVKESFVNTFCDFGILVFGKKDKNDIEPPKIVINGVNIEIKNSNPSSDLRAFICYREGIGTREFKYHKKNINLQPGENAYPLTDFPHLSGGKHILTAVKYNNTEPVSVATVFFYTDDPLLALRLSYKNPVLIPAPKKEFWSPGIFNFKTVKEIIFYPSPDGLEEKTAQKIQKYLAEYGLPAVTIKQGTEVFIKNNAVIMGSIKNDTFTAALKNDNAKMLSAVNSIPVQKDGYVLKTENSRAILAGQDGAGAYYAFRTLLQIIRQDPDAVPECSIIDWPDTAIRGITEASILNSHNSDQLWEEYIFECVAAYKYNELQLCSRYLIFSTDPVVGAAGNGSVDFVKKAVSICKEHFIAVVPFMMSHSHSDWLLKAHPELAQFPEKYNVKKRTGVPMLANPNHPQFYNLLFPLVKESWEIFGKSKSFHIGHDEIEDYGPGDENTAAEIREIILQDILKQASFLKELGVTEVRMWADMLIKDFNGGPPLNTELIRDKLPKDLITPMHWLSMGTREAGLEKTLVKSGFKNILFSANRTEYADKLPDDPQKFKGFYANRWASTAHWFIFPDTLYKGGDKKIRYQFMGIAYQGDMFWNILGKKKPFTEFLSASGTGLMRITSSCPAGSKTKYAEIQGPSHIKEFDQWRLPQKGFNFSPIEKEIDSSRFKTLHQKQSILLNVQHPRITMPVNKTGSHIALLHTAHLFIKDHDLFINKVLGKYLYYQRLKQSSHSNVDGPAVAEYILEYSDGTIYKKDIILGYNLYLWNGNSYASLPYLLFAVSEIWEAKYNADDHLSAQIFILNNPYPEKIIKSLTLQKTEPAVEIAVLGICCGTN